MIRLKKRPLAEGPELRYDGASSYTSIPQCCVVNETFHLVLVGTYAMFTITCLVEVVISKTVQLFKHCYSWTVCNQLYSIVDLYRQALHYFSCVEITLLV